MGGARLLKGAGLTEDVFVLVLEVVALPSDGVLVEESAVTGLVLLVFRPAPSP